MVSPSGFGNITSGTNQTPFSSGSFIHEDLVSLTATPIPGKSFSHWQVDDNISFASGYSENNQSIEFQLIEDANLTAIFDTIDYNVSVTILALNARDEEISESPGFVTFNDLEDNQSIFTYNQDLNLSATTNQNFTFIGWFDPNGAETSPQISVTKDQNITAKSRKGITLFTDIFPNFPTGGTISVTGYSDQDYLYFGESISFTANELDHREFESWSDTPETDLSRSITIDSSTPTIEATFSPLSYDLNISVSPSGFGNINFRHQSDTLLFWVLYSSGSRFTNCDSNTR